MHNLLFSAHTLCMNYVTNTFLLVSSSVRSKQLLCFVHSQGQKREQKPTTKNAVGFHNHSRLLTMFMGTFLALFFLFFVNTSVDFFFPFRMSFISHACHPFTLYGNSRLCSFHMPWVDSPSTLGQGASELNIP